VRGGNSGACGSAFSEGEWWVVVMLQQAGRWCCAREARALLV